MLRILGCSFSNRCNKTELTLAISIFISFLILGVIFYKFSWIDIYFSALFYDSNTRHFPLRHSMLTSTVDHIAMGTACIAGLYLFVATVYELRNYQRYIISKCRNKHKISNKPSGYDFAHAIVLSYLVILFLVYCCLTGFAIKHIFHRVRPLHMQEFGGNLSFTPAFMIGSQCTDDCSFVSAHASAGFMFCALILLIQRFRCNIRMWCIVILLGFVFGISRIAGGYHFLSDVVFSCAWTLSISWITYMIFKYFTTFVDINSKRPTKN